MADAGAARRITVPGLKIYLESSRCLRSRINACSARENMRVSSALAQPDIVLVTYRAAEGGANFENSSGEIRPTPLESRYRYLPRRQRIEMDIAIAEMTEERRPVARHNPANPLAGALPRLGSQALALSSRSSGASASPWRMCHSTSRADANRAGCGKAAFQPLVTW